VGCSDSSAWVIMISSGMIDNGIDFQLTSKFRSNHILETLLKAESNYSVLER